ncbi:MAG: hypothetical protein VYA08_10750, partial [Pseudomonadota bacterium]|nr:hypothetical protein [Pseudomonadota bacterium]
VRSKARKFADTACFYQPACYSDTAYQSLQFPLLDNQQVYWSIAAQVQLRFFLIKPRQSMLPSFIGRSH